MCGSGRLVPALLPEPHTPLTDKRRTEIADRTWQAASSGQHGKIKQKKETGSHEPVPIIFRCCKNLFGCDNDNLDVGEDALVALNLALELSELLDVGN